MINEATAPVPGFHKAWTTCIQTGDQPSFQTTILLTVYAAEFICLPKQTLSRMMRAGFISRSHVKLIFIIPSVPACLYISSFINHFISIRTASVQRLGDKDRRQL